MRKILLIILILTSSIVYGDEIPKIKNIENGWFTQHFEKPKVSYYVDTVTGLCFVAGEGVGGLTNIPCNNLKFRREWSEIITW